MQLSLPRLTANDDDEAEPMDIDMDDSQAGPSQVYVVVRCMLAFVLAACMCPWCCMLAFVLVAGMCP